MELIALSALDDNYIWMLHNGVQAIVVDPGHTQPVVDALVQYNLQLAAILVTHHHADHTAGINALRPLLEGHVFGPAREDIPKPYQPVQQGDMLSLLGLQVQVLEVPGHTAGHLAYYLSAQNLGEPNELTEGIVFTGDTLFSGGSGRVFEGTRQQMWHSLEKLAALPASTRVCAGHEYTLSNLRFARVVEPDNEVLRDYQAHCQQLRDQNQPTLPSTIRMELAINPFLRVKEPSVIRAAQKYYPEAQDAVSVFTVIRKWKDHLK